MWKSTLESRTGHRRRIIWRMRFVCRITEAPHTHTHTHTHTQNKSYCFSTTQMLREGPTIIRYVYRVIQNDCRGFNNLSCTIHLVLQMQPHVNLMFIGPWINAIVEEWKTSLMSLASASTCKTNTTKYQPQQKLQHTTNWEQDDRCDNSSTQSQAPEDGYINVRNMLSA